MVDSRQLSTAANSFFTKAGLLHLYRSVFCSEETLLVEDSFRASSLTTNKLHQTRVQFKVPTYRGARERGSERGGARDRERDKEGRGRRLRQIIHLTQ